MAETLPPSDPRIQKIRETLEAGMPKDAEGNPIVETFGTTPGAPKVRLAKDEEGKLHIAKPGEPPDTAPSPEKLTQLSFGEFDATETPASRIDYLAQDAESGIVDMHKMMNRRKGAPQLHKEARRDADRERREFLKAIGAQTPAERKKKLQMIIAPLEIELLKRAGIWDLLTEQPMSAEIVEKMREKISELRRLAKTPEFQKLAEQKAGAFRYWKYLTRLYKIKPRREYIYKG